MVLVRHGFQTLLVNDECLPSSGVHIFSIQASSNVISKVESNTQVEVNIRKIDHYSTIAQLLTASQLL